MSRLSMNLQFLRKKKQMTQVDVSEALHLGEHVLSNYEKGIREPDYDTLLKFAEFYDVSTDYLLKEDEETQRWVKQLRQNIRQSLPDLIESSDLWKKYKKVKSEDVPLKAEKFIDALDYWKALNEKEMELACTRYEADNLLAGNQWWDAQELYEDCLFNGDVKSFVSLLQVCTDIMACEKFYDCDNEFQEMELELELLERVATYCAITYSAIASNSESMYAKILGEDK